MNLFDIIEQEDNRDAMAAGAACKHPIERESTTDWGPPYGVRMTATCNDCGRVRGRYPNESLAPALTSGVWKIGPNSMTTERKGQ